MSCLLALQKESTAWLGHPQAGKEQGDMRLCMQHLSPCQKYQSRKELLPSA